MKTLRQLLLERHQSTESKLDAIRQNTLQNLKTSRSAESHRASPRKSNAPARPTAFEGWRDWVLSLRWHLTGLGAAWLVILLLNTNVGRSPDPATQLASLRDPNPKQILVSLYEYRRQLLEMLGTPPSEPALPPRRRGEFQPTQAIV